MEFVIFKKK